MPAPLPGGPILWGRKHQPHRYRNDVRGYPQFCIFLVTAGDLRADFAEGPGEARHGRWVRQGQAIVLPPGADFTLSTPTGPYHGHVVEMSPGTCRIPPYCRIFPWDRAVAATVADIEGEYARPGGEGLLPLLYAVLHRRALRQAEGLAEAVADAAGRVAELLRAHVYTRAPLAEILGGEAALRRARRLCRAAGRPSPKRMLLELKLAEGERLLRVTRLSVTAIAFDLGFPSAQHFATRFRRWRGRTPSQARAHA